tara:strand:+ start:277 stop:525 length:249 start_codon:yes stop_codon:yes gene_type:complete
MPLASGENVQRDDRFAAWLRSDILGVMQPDLAKWGGLSRTVPLARQIIASGKRYCPHYLGGGIGLWHQRMRWRLLAVMACWK